MADFVFGYDFFISYSHSDGKNYPTLLAGRLERAGFRTFLDSRIYVAGDDLNAATKRRVRMSKCLIVVARASALHSAWVKKEVEHSLAANRRVVVIDCNQAFELSNRQVPLRALLEHHLRIRETCPDLDGEPSASVVHELTRSFQSTRQETVRLRVVSGVAVSLFASLLAVALMYRRSESARQQAVEQRDAALRSQSLFLANVSQEAIAGHDSTTGILLALEALPRDPARPDRPYVPEAEQALHAALISHREIAVLTGHKGPVHLATFSPDGSMIVTAGADHDVRVWDSATARLVTLLKRGTHSLSKPTFHPAGDRILVACEDRSARVYDAASGAEMLTLSGHSRAITTVAYSRDGSLVATGDDEGHARIWNGQTGALLLTVLHSDHVRNIEFSPDGQRFVTAGDDGTARVWETATGTQISVLVRFGETVYSAVFGPDGNTVLATSDDRWAGIWSATGEPKAMLSGDRGFQRYAIFNHDGTRIAALTSSGAASLWDVNAEMNVRLITALEGHSGAVTAIAFSPLGNQIATVGVDGALRLWDSAGKALSAVSGHRGRIHGLSWAPDGQRLVTASEDGTARIVDTSPSGRIRMLRGHEIGYLSSLAISPDGNHAATGSQDHTARLWDLTSWRQRAVLQHGEGVKCVSFSRDSTRIVSGSSDRTARIWDVASGKELGVLKHPEAVSFAAFTSVGNRLISCSRDIHVWDLEQGREMCSVNIPRGDFAQIKVRLAPDDSRIVAAGLDGMARVFDASNCASLAVLAGHTKKVNAATFSPDSTTIATVSDDGSLRIWDAARFTELKRITGHTAPVAHLEFSRDGQMLLTASNDKTVRVWNPQTGSAISILRGHTDVVKYATFSADGQRVVSVSPDFTIRLWNPRTGSQTAVFTDPVHGGLSYAEFTPDSRWLGLIPFYNEAKFYPAFTTLDSLLSYAHSIVPRTLDEDERRHYFLESKH